MGKSMRVLVGFILSILALVFQIVGFATPYWTSRDVRVGNIDLGTIHAGLWQSCSSATGCVEVDIENCDTSNCQQYKAVRAMESLAFICLFLACVLATLHSFVMQNRTQMRRFGAVISIFGAILGIIGVIIYASLDEIEASTLHFSFAFCVIAAAAGFVSGLLMINVDRSEETTGLLSK